ncbi:OmpA family protein [Nguyenibacter vanlangensis]|uniref:OmpA family protein n=1 Tax=Nguyenibacter vanlangensis TaxID=1216886 RepID=A0A7Y7IWT9_9PROT|nr:OmpA family protein [Nguyenibacter vanlangensis]NVN11774.1 OmpA family protein [Nguyenibacter vanlangensis]
MTLRHGLLTGSFLAASCALGAVLSVAPAAAQPVQGLYVAGAGGASFNQDQRVRSSPNFPDGRDSYHTGVTGIGSVGWGLGNGFRVEIEGNYRNNGLQGFNSGAVPGSRAGGRQQTYGVMANALFDMDIGKSWLFPYFGAGVGYAWQAMNASVTAPNNSFSQQIGGTYGNFAYQGIFGLAFPVPWVVGLSATAEYRFWTMLGPQSHGARALGTIGGYDMMHPYGASSGNRDTKTDFNHSLLLGLRYEFNPAPPPPPPAPEPAAPAPAQSRTYLVFFDWDKAALTERARSIVAAAAQASTHTQTTRIEVDGYTDNSAAHPGPRGARYNMVLSLRRAQAVQAELVRDGVPGAAIEIHGFGESHPLVPTGPNTREPQNRRVEIILK